MQKQLVRRDPLDVFTPFLDFGRRLDEFVGRRDEGGMIVPAIDISETDDAVVLQAELPGMKKDDVKITLEDGVLTLSGEKKVVAEETKKDYHRVERRYGRFHRAFNIPSGVDTSKADAKFEDGVLAIALPKSEAAKPRTLEIG